jgi:integrase
MKIRRVKQKSGWKGWQVDFGMVTQPDGTRRRVQKCFSTQADAQKALGDAKDKRQVYGDSAMTLTEDERVRFVAARDQLATAGATIEEAVAAFMRTAKAVCDPQPLGTLLDRCIEDKAAVGKRHLYVRKLWSSCNSFIAPRKDQLAHTVTPAEVQAWISGNGWAPKTQRVYLGDLHTLFAWANSKRIMATNPASQRGPDRIVLLPMEDKEIGRLSVNQVKRLVRAAARVPGPKEEDFRPLLWYVVIATFAGVRPKEVARMDRADVDLEERHVVVQGRHSKTRQRRTVDLTAEACAWLALDPRRTGKIVPKNLKKRWLRLRRSAGLEPWPHDGARHTFASMHYAQHQDEALLKAQMGHSEDEDTLMQSYRALATRKEAVEFWGFMPSARRMALWKQIPPSFAGRKHNRPRLRVYVPR